jgi:3'-phosphoadenosine 5'-phosphosulfate sulfotransferase (PAPS reductase)/FAD synthetase
MNLPKKLDPMIIDTINLDTLSFVDAKPELDSIESNAYKLFEKAVDDIKIIRRKYPVIVASSFGKDSTITLLAALEAHMQLVRDGEIPQDAKFYVTTIDTLVENHLIKLLVNCEIAKLEKFGEENNINIDIRVGSPNLSRQWAPMFLSGLKVLSLSKMNNDCSSELKIASAARIESALAKENKGVAVTLLGSRVQESTARKQSLISRSQHNKRAEDLVEFADKDRTERVFAPIVNMSSEEVWLLLRRAGTLPLTNPSEGFYKIPSYASNHAMLSVVYADASDGSCPISTKQIKGAKTSAGGCGGSARTGCFTCLKPKLDKSAQLLSRSKRHGNINLNMLKVRNYMMHIGSDISYRSFHTRAIDQSTSAIAAQPNVLNAETLDYLIHLMCNVTVDEIIRARSFKEKVAVGDEMLDEGYADIFSDNGMTDTEKAEFSAAYRKFAVEPMIAPMNEKIAIYLSAIHARDGIKLPAYRAIYLYKRLVIDFLEAVEEARYDFPTFSLDKAYKQVRKDYEENGIRHIYPDVDPTSGVNSIIPDAVMIIPKLSFREFSFVPHAGGLDLEQADGCLVTSKLNQVRVPFKLAKRLLPENILSTMTNYKNSDKVDISGFDFSTPLVTTFLDKSRKKKLTHKFSKRSIKKISRANKSFRVIQRGRTSLDTPSFGLRTSNTSLTESIANNVLSVSPAIHNVYEPFLSMDEDAANAYEINEEHLMNWVDYDGLEHAIKAHDDSVAIRLKWDKHIYFFHSSEPFESLMRWGVLDLNNKAKLNTMKILKRTAYFSTIGLFRLDDKKFSEFANQSASNASFKMSDFRNTRTSVQIQADSILTMKQYRAYKAKLLLPLRRGRNITRSKLKNDYASYLADPIDYSFTAIESGLKAKVSEALNLMDELIEVTFSFENNTFHPVENKKVVMSTYNAFLRYVYSYTSDLESAYELMPKSVVKQVKNNSLYRMRLQEILSKLNDSFVTNMQTAVSKFKLDQTKSMDTTFDLVEKINSSYKLSKSYVPYEMNDSPAEIVSEIEW